MYFKSFTQFTKTKTSILEFEKDIITDLQKYKIIKDYYELLYCKKLDKLKEMNVFLKTES